MVKSAIQINLNVPKVKDGSSNAKIKALNARRGKTQTSHAL